MKKLFKQHLVWVLLLFICSMVILFPIFKPGLLVTDDGDWMVIRLSAFYQSLRDGQFPVRFLTRLNYSYGYPVSNFLYPGFLYIGSLVHIFGVSFVSSVESIIVLSVIIGSIGIFYWLRLYFSPQSSFLGAFSFLLSPYLLYDIYIRGSVGELVAIGLWGFLLYFLESKKKWGYIPLLSFLLISHNTLSLFYLSVLVLLIFVKGYKSFIIPSIWAVCMSAFFWMPAILEKRFVIFDSVSVSDPSHYFTSSLDLLSKSLPFVAAAILFALNRGKQYKATGILFICLLAITLFLSLSISGFLWNGYLLRTFIQFPYRVFALWLCIGPWFIAYVGDSYKANSGKYIALLSIFIFIYFALPYAKSQSIVRPEGFYSTNEATTTVMNEYMPRWVTLLPTKRTGDRIEVFKGNARITVTEISTKMIAATVNAVEDTVVQVNTLYYPGWGAQLDDKPITISYDNGLGLMRIIVPKGAHRLYMAFRETKSRFIADLISAASILLYFGLVLFPFVSRRFKRVTR